MRVRLLVTMTLLTLIATACTGGVEPDRAAGGGVTLPSERVLLGTANGPVLVDVASGDVVFDAQGAVSSLGGAWALSAATHGGSTALEFIDGASGEVLSTVSVPGELEPRIVSESGAAVALMEPLPEGWDPSVPFTRSRTRIVVADPTGARDPISLDLRGNFEPEAFSVDDGSLFLIQHLPAETPTAYRVTMLDLSRGSLRDLGPDKVRPVFGPFDGPPERMPGTRLSQLLAPDADQLYTLYTSARPGYAPHGARVAEDAAVSFVHVLSLRDGWAHCVGLPEAMWDRPASAQAMATTPDGSYLFVIDAGRDVVAAMHTGSLRVRTSEVDLPFDGAIARTSAQVSPDGDVLYVAVAGDDTAAAFAGDDGSTVAALDAATFEVLATWHVPGSVSGVGVSSDGASVYAAVDGGVVVLDATSGDALDEVAVPTVGPVLRVQPIAG